MKAIAPLFGLILALSFVGCDRDTPAAPPVSNPASTAMTPSPAALPPTTATPPPATDLTKADVEREQREANLQVKEAARAAEAHTGQRVEAGEAEARARLAELDRKIEKMKADARAEKAEARRDLDTTTADLETKRKDLAARLEAMGESADKDLKEQWFKLNQSLAEVSASADRFGRDVKDAATR
jgi:multidrug efflux pump subunit AcrA (membrane-fusion protein)